MRETLLLVYLKILSTIDPILNFLLVLFLTTLVISHINLGIPAFSTVLFLITTTILNLNLGLLSKQSLLSGHLTTLELSGKRIIFLTMS